MVQPIVYSLSAEAAGAAASCLAGLLQLARLRLTAVAVAATPRVLSHRFISIFPFSNRRVPAGVVIPVRRIRNNPSPASRRRPSAAQAPNFWAPGACDG